MEPLGIIGAVGVLVGLFWAAQRLRAIPMAAQIEAKDQVIATWEQNAAADKERIGALEGQVGILSEKLSEALQTIAKLQGQVEQLEKFSAPEAVARFEQQQEVMIGILRELADHHGVRVSAARARGL